jgi:membrane dipeptidase
MTMPELDALAARHFPMVGIQAPPELLFTVDEWFKAVDYVIALVGEDHVMLGTDLDGGPTLPRGMRDCRDLPLLTEAMLKRGYSEKRIRKFLGENLLRVVRQVTER